MWVFFIMLVEKLVNNAYYKMRYRKNVLICKNYNLRPKITSGTEINRFILLHKYD